MKFITPIPATDITAGYDKEDQLIQEKRDNLIELNKFIDEINRFVELASQTWMLDAGHGAAEGSNTSEHVVWTGLSREFSQQKEMSNILFEPNSAEHKSALSAFKAKHGTDKGKSFATEIDQWQQFGIFLFMHADELCMLQLTLDELLALIDKEITVFEKKAGTRAALQKVKDEIIALNNKLSLNLVDISKRAKDYSDEKIQNPLLLDHYQGRFRYNKQEIVINRLAELIEKLNVLVGKEKFSAPTMWIDTTLPTAPMVLLARCKKLNFANNAVNIRQLINNYLLSKKTSSSVTTESTTTSAAVENESKNAEMKRLYDFAQETYRMMSLASPDPFSDDEGLSTSKRSSHSPVEATTPDLMVPDIFDGLTLADMIAGDSNTAPLSVNGLTREIRAQVINFRELSDEMHKRWDDKFYNAVRKQEILLNPPQEKQFRSSVN